MKDRYYSVCAYVGDERVMKQTLTAKHRAEAIECGKVILRKRGFDISDEVHVVAVPIAGRQISKTLTGGNGRRRASRFHLM
jgi:hypothetical protein